MLLAFVLAAAIVLFVLMYQRKLSKERNQLQALKISHQTALIHAAIQAVENERQQFAANLHDEIGAHLSIAKMTLGANLDSASTNDTSVEKTLEILDSAVASIRSISHNLLPPVLLKLGLSKAIETALRKLPDDIQTSLELDPNLGRFAPEIELHAYRIFQEAISNSIKHANGTSIHVQLQNMAPLFLLKITDNGQGFNPKQNAGLGLLNMQSRAEIISCDLKIEQSASGVSIQLTPQKQI